MQKEDFILYAPRYKFFDKVTLQPWTKVAVRNAIGEDGIRWVEQNQSVLELPEGANRRYAARRVEHPSSIGSRGPRRRYS